MFGKTGNCSKNSVTNSKTSGLVGKFPVFRLFIFGLILSLPAAMFYSAFANEKSQPSEATYRPSLLVVVTAGTRWGSLDLQNPKLGSLLKYFDRAALGNNLHYTGTKVTCPVAAWLTLSAADTIPIQTEDTAKNCGRLAEALTPVSDGVATVSTDAGRSVRVKAENFSQWQRWAASRTSNPQLGSLNQFLASKQVKATAIGSGAAIGLMDSEGRTRNYHDLPSSNATLNRLVLDSLQTSQLVVVDLSEKFTESFPVGTQAQGAVNSFGLASLDRQSDRATENTALLINSLFEKLPPGQSVMLMDIAEAGATPHLGVAAYNGPGFNGGVLESKTIRQPGLVHTVDFTQAIVKFFGISPTNTTDMPISGGFSSAKTADRQLFLMEQAAWADIIRMVQIPFYIGFGVLIALALGATVYLASCRYRQKNNSAGMRILARVTLLTCILYFPASYILTLLPFSLATGLADSRSRSLLNISEATIMLHMVGITLASALILAGICWLGAKWIESRVTFLRPNFPAISTGLWAATLAAGFSYLTIAVSIFLGAPDQLNTVVGSSALSITRFFGINNAKYTFLVCALLVIMLAAGTLLKAEVISAGNPHQLVRAKAVLVGLIIATLLIDGMPNLGADVGGPLALIIAALILYHRIWQKPFTLRVFFKAGVYAILSTAFFALVDYLLPGGPTTHLGGFVRSLRAGQGTRIIAHKLQAMTSTFFGNAWALLFSMTLLLIFAALALRYYLGWRENRKVTSDTSCSGAAKSQFGIGEIDSAIRDLLAAGTSFALLAAVTNDSGALIIGCAMAVIIPTLGLILNESHCELPHN